MEENYKSSPPRISEAYVLSEHPGKGPLISSSLTLVLVMGEWFHGHTPIVWISFLWTLQQC
jgi:hypothetical protein